MAPTRSSPGSPERFTLTFVLAIWARWMPAPTSILASFQRQVSFRALASLRSVALVFQPFDCCSFVPESSHVDPARTCQQRNVIVGDVELDGIRVKGYLFGVSHR